MHSGAHIHLLRLPHSVTALAAFVALGVLPQSLLAQAVPTSNTTITGNNTYSSGTTSAILSGSGNVIIAAGNATVTMTGLSTYTGVTTINSGTLSTTQLANTTASGIGASSGSSSNLVINGGTLKYTGAAGTVTRSFSVGTNGATLDASGTGVLTLSNTTAIGLNSQTGNRTLTLTGTSGGLNTLAAAITDDGNGNQTSIVKNGTGQWVLSSANNTYTGSTTINAGTLTIANTSVVTTSNITIASGATLSVANSTTLTSYKLLTGAGTVSNLSQTFNNLSGQTVSGTLTFTGSFTNTGTFSPGNSPGITVISGNYFENGLLNMEIQTTTPGTGHDQVRVGGAAQVSGGTLVVQTYNSVLPTKGNIYQLFADSVGGAKALTGTFSSVKFDADGAAGSGAPVQNYAVILDTANGQLIATGLNAATSTVHDLAADLTSNTALRQPLAVFLSTAGAAGQNQINSSTSEGALALGYINGTVNIAATLPYINSTEYGSLGDYTLVNDEALNSELNRVTAGMQRGVYVGYIDNSADSADGVDINRRESYAGFNNSIGDKTIMGVLVSHHDGDMTGATLKAKADGMGAKLYVRYKATDRLSLLASTGFGKYDYTMQRTALASTLGATSAVSAKTHGNSFTAALSANYDAYRTEHFSVAPQIGLIYGNSRIDMFRETGTATYKEVVRSQKVTRLLGQAIVAGGWHSAVLKMPVTLEVTAGLSEVFVDEKPAMLVGVGSALNIMSVELANEKKTNFTCGVRGGIEVIKNASFTAGYSRRGSGQTSSHLWDAGLSYQF